MKPNLLRSLFRSRNALPVAPWIALVVCGTALATEISNAPLFTSSAAAVKPNIMFILDDSGSMKSDYLPDEASQFSAFEYGRTASQCNGVAYNPDINYAVPVDYTGTRLPAASLAFITPDPVTQTTTQRTLGSAINTIPAVGNSITVQPQGKNPRSSWYTSGDVVTVFQSSTSYFVGTVTSWNSSNRNLVISVTLVAPGAATMASPSIGDGEPNSATYFTYTGSEPRLGFTYSATGGVITSSNFYRQCNSTIGSDPGRSVFTRVAVTAASAEAQNYANWYKYYRTRMDMMKSSVSLAFAGIDNRYRLGYSTISEDTAAEGTNFLNIREVDATQKRKFYEAFNAAQPISYTPLRGALAKAGQYYAKKANGQTEDPLQYSCQRNFTILSTDGYWNTPDESTTSPKYGPYRLDNTTAVGQQDGGATRRPMYDGGEVTATTTETWTTRVTTTSTITTPSTKTDTTVVTSASFTSNGSFSRQSYQDFVRVWSLAVNSFTRDASGVVTVTTGSNHNMVTGDTVTVSTSSSNSFAQGLQANTVPVTRLSDTTFSYFDPGSTGTGSGSSTMTVKPTISASCSAGSGVSRTFVQIKNGSYTVSTTSTTAVTTSTSTVTETKVDSTPWTRTIKVVNGAVVSDDNPGVAGTTATSTSNTNPSLATGTTATSASTSSATAVSVGNTYTTVPGLFTATGTSCTNNSSVVSNSQTSSTAGVSGQSKTDSVTASGAPQTVVIGTVGPVDTPNPHASSTVNSTSGGAENTLADVAMYYYETDLRTAGLSNCTGNGGGDVCNNNVPGETGDAAHSFGDNANWQHMTTFTLGLGLSGLLTYDQNYLTQQAGSFYDILSNGKNWPVPGGSKSAENIDDLWHAAVNGRGQYFSAGDPVSLARSLNAALDSIKQITGAASAASTSSLQPVQGDNDIYVAQFTTAKWIGDVLSFKIDPSTGLIDKTATWSAQAQLDRLAPGDRTIYYPSSRTRTLRSFSYSNLSDDGYARHFDRFCEKTGANGASSPEQCTSLLTPTQVDLANDGSSLVSYLRGSNALNNLYRSRASLLGDIINASPLFVGKPAFRYEENNYQAFVTAKATRAAVVLAAANDGMLHAFERDTGREKWAFIPTFVLPNLYKLADTSYGNNHSYYVDGSPQVGDIFADDGTGPQWKTIVVGGLNAGGRGYYALDVTNPIAPKLLWEFQHRDLGLSFGNPVITKRTDGTWVVVFGSGYNNDASTPLGTGDGNGHLFVLNANTGELILKVDTMIGSSTPVGSAGNPSGLARVNVWVDSETNNTAKRFYGGDLLGNVWRFDIDALVEPKGKALRLAQLTSPDGTVQPITVKPPLAEVQYNGQKYPVVYVPTGRYLGTSDLSDTKVQSVYGIKDPLVDQGWGVARSNPAFVTQTLVASGNTRSNDSNNKVDWSTKAGWRVDLPVGGERVSVNPQLALETLFVGTNIPNNDACTVGGNSFLYQFNINGGTSVSTYIGNVLVQGLTVVQLTTGGAAGALDTIITRSDGSLQTEVGTPSASSSGLRRTSWRELVD